MRVNRKTRRNEWQTLSRQKIQEAVVRLLSRGGAAEPTMEQVAAEAGVAKGTLYLYFKDKRALLASVKETALRPMREELFGLLESEAPPSERIERFVRRHLGYFEERRGLFRVLLWERQPPAAHLERRRSSGYRLVVERVGTVLREGMQRGEFRSLDPHKVAAMLLEADIALIQQRLWGASPGPVDEDARLLVEVFLRGLTVPRPSVARRR